APRFLAATLLAAVDHWRRTGEGQRIEQSQMESALYYLAPEILDYQLSGRVPRRAGNEHPEQVPHAAYPVAGEDEWIAIAVEDDGQWEALKGVMGSPGWAADPVLDSAAGRVANRSVVDERMAEWTASQDARALMDLLQAAGVPAGAVQRSSDHLVDPQLAHREFFHPLEHPEMGTVPYEGHQFAISGYASGPRSAAPCLGEHSMEVLLEVLGMSPDEVAEVASGLG
ncbi:MAG TPA: CoA transferase, partial [Tepidiformaceae bacterium]|nr:CoA transferase [Tepidiformaceae bacterium]